LAYSFLKTYPTNTPANGFTNPPGHISGPYYDVDDADNRAWLSSELYRTTCELSYAEDYVNYIKSVNNIIAMGGNDFIDYRVEAHWAFYFAGNECSARGVVEPANYATVRQWIRASFIRTGEGSKSRVRDNTYKNIGRTDVPGKLR
jgi:hypothetical protein